MGNEKLTVVCMLWGDWCAPYGLDYVNKLYRMVERHLSLPHTFVCFTDNLDLDYDEGIEVKLIPAEVMKWGKNLPKFYMYAPDNGISGRILFMDLDSVIVDSIDEIASYDGPWIGVKPFNPDKHHTGGGLLSFIKEEWLWLWDKVSERPTYWAKATQGGKERLIYKRLLEDPDHWQTSYPGLMVGYKKHCKKQGKYPHNARFIAFHGLPRPHEVRDPWVIKNWR
jgi:hypothetical protein